MIQFFTKFVSNFGTCSLFGIFFTFSVNAVEIQPDLSFLFFPTGPESEFLEASDLGLSPGFCSAWNPDYGFTGPQCCAVKGQYFITSTSKSKKGRRQRFSRRACPSKRARFSYCSDRLPFQVDYENQVRTSEIDNLLRYLEKEAGTMGPQGYCSSDSGFLAWGRPILETSKNRVKLRSADRCLNYGTDRMALLVEWLSDRVIETYPANPDRTVPQPAPRRRIKGKRLASGGDGGIVRTSPGRAETIHLLVGNISAPRGGCVAGPSGRRSHRSHTNGKDVDIAFLSEKRIQPVRFHTEFEPEINWWFLKSVFSNPKVCIKGVYLDRRHISKLRKFAWNDPDWIELSPFIQHFKGHRHHFHIRIGDHSGKPGCGSTEAPEEEDQDEVVGDDASSETGEAGADVDNSSSIESGESGESGNQSGHGSANESSEDTHGDEALRDLLRESSQ